MRSQSEKSDLLILREGRALEMGCQDEMRKAIVEGTERVDLKAVARDC